MLKDVVLVNGEIMEAQAAAVAFGDRSMLFGDGVFETVPVYNGRAFALLPHIEALFKSVIGIKIPGIYTVEELVQFHEELIAATGLVNGEIHTRVTRGTGSLELDFPAMVVPELTMFAVAKDRQALTGMQEKGVNVITESDERWQRCDINTLNRLPEVLARQKARESNAFDVLFVRDGKVTEAVDSNFMIIKDEIIWTHPDNHLIHPTITRRLVKERLAPDLGMQVVEKAFTVAFALSADEAFLVGPSCEIVPVTKIDRAFMSQREPGDVTKELQRAFRKFVLAECPVRD